MLFDKQKSIAHTSGLSNELLCIMQEVEVGGRKISDILDLRQCFTLLEPELRMSLTEGQILF